MRKLQLLKKTFLVVAGLLVGSSAWAEDYYNVTRYSQDYEDATTYTTGWVFESSYSQGTNGENHYLNMSVSNNNAQRTNSISFANNAYFSGATDYLFSFDYGYGSGNAYAKPSSLTVKGKNGATLFTFANTDGGWGTTATLSDSENNSLGTYTATYKVISNPFLNFTIKANSTDGVVLTVDNNGTKIANAVKIADFTTIESIELVVTGGASCFGIDNMILKEHSENAVAEDPTFTFSKVAGANRVYTITNPNSSGKLYYTTTSADTAPAVGDNAYSSTTEKSIDVTYGTGTYYSYAVLEDGTTTSAIVSQAVTGGNITLNKPYFTIISYNADNATTTVSLNSDVSGILGTPAVTLKYKIDDGEENSTTNGGNVDVIDGSTIVFYAEAEGYTTSESVTAVATSPNSNPVLWAETYKGVVNADKSFTLGTDIIATENGTNYYYVYYDDNNQLSSNLLAAGVYNNNMLRTKGYYSGQTASLAIYNLQEGDYVTITGEYGNGNFELTGNSTDLTLDDWHTIIGSKYCFTVKRTGSVRISLSRYGYLQSITVQRDYEAPDQPIGYVTDIEQTMRKISFACLTDGATIYYNETTDDLESNGWIKYENEFLTNSEYVYAYAQIGTLKSTVLKYKAGAGQSIPLNSPTITRTGTSTYTIKATSTTYAGITADPSDQTIHWTINGGEEQIQNGPDAYLENVDGDIVYWTTDNNSKFGESGKVTETYFVPTVTITDAGWATFYTDLALDFSGLSDKFKTYIAIYDGSTVTLSEVSDVPGGTGVVLKGKAGEYKVPVIAASNTVQGDLMGSTTEDLEYDQNADLDYYMLAWNDQTKKAQFMLLNSGTIAKGKAYLAVSKATQSDGQNRALAVVFEGESVATGIQSVGELKAGNDAIYSLSGQRVSQPARGLFIVNGKKVIK